jgi:methionyl-tRNA formyltransferase
VPAAQPIIDAVLPGGVNSADLAYRIVYFGLPLGALLLAADGHALDLCVLSPVAAPGERRLRHRVNTEVLGADELEAREPDLLSRFEREPPELLVSWFWTRRLTRAWLAVPRRAALGVHPSLLPRHRGPDPYYWAIDAGDLETGVTAHLLEASYDTGALLGRERLAIGARNAWQLARALDRPSLRLLRRVVSDFARGEPPAAVPQDETCATLAPQPDGEELRVRWEWPTDRVLRRIRALSPTPGVGLEISGVEFHVTAARPAPTYVAALEPGEADLREGVTLRTGDGAVVVEWPADPRSAVVARTKLLAPLPAGIDSAAEAFDRWIR